MKNKVFFEGLMFIVQKIKNKKDVKKKAIKSIEELYLESKKTKDNQIKKEIFKQIWAIKLKFNIKLSENIKNSFCKKCFNSNFRTRTNKNRVIITCNNCGYTKRINLK